MKCKICGSKNRLIKTEDGVYCFECYSEKTKSLNEPEYIKIIRRVASENIVYKDNFTIQRIKKEEELKEKWRKEDEDSV